MKIVIYKKQGCPRCKILSQKLKLKGIEYEESLDTEKIIAMGADSFPQMQIDDGPLMDLKEANEWVNAQEARK